MRSVAASANSRSSVIQAAPSMGVAMPSSAPIGVFDSGVGGISVLREIRARLAQESLIYVADSRYVPYGEKSPDFIRARSRLIADFLSAQGAKALVLACNTATAAAVAEL